MVLTGADFTPQGDLAIFGGHTEREGVTIGS